MPSVPQPQVQIFQQFKQYPSEITDPLRVCLIGPEYKLHRYTGGVTGEKVEADDYEAVGGNAFTWNALGRAAGAVVDQEFSKVFLENALLEYYRNTGGTYVIPGWNSSSSSGAPGAGQSSSSSSYAGSPDSTATVYNVYPYLNKIKVTGINLKANGSTYPLNSSFYNRPVAVGDHVRIWNTINGVEFTTDAKVAGLEADAVASVVSAAAGAASNSATNSSATAASAITKGGTVNNVTITPTATSYNGLLNGVLSETYTVKVRRGSTDGDARTAIIDITTSSGKDDLSGLTFATSSFTTSQTLGANGATFVFSMGGETDLTTGQTFATTITQQFYAPTPTANTGDNYTGDDDTTYILTVTRGGSVADSDKPVLSVTTTKGNDSGAPITVAVAATPYAVGNYGVTVQFAVASGTLKFRKGDQYYIPVTAAGDGPYRTIVLDRSIERHLRATSTQYIDLNLSLSIVDDVELGGSENYTENWTQDADGLTINGGIRLFHSEWRSGIVTLPVLEADVFIHWRELIQDHADTIYSCDNIGDLDTTIDTEIDTDNPLGYGLNKALLNSNGTSARFIAVETNDLAGYLTAIDKLEVRDDAYFIVPLTFDRTIIDEVVGHVKAMSVPTKGQWRIAVVCPTETNPTNIVKYEADGETTVIATTSSTTLTLDPSSGVSFNDAEVKAGDIVRVRIGPGEDGETTYESYVVDVVNSAQQLTLTVAPDPVLGAAQPIEIWRTLNSTGSADQIAENCGVFASSRVYAVQPYKIKSGGVEVDGYYLAAAIAGLKSGVVPHQGITNLTLTGFDNADRIVKRFNRTQLDEMASAGSMLVVHDLKTGAVYPRHQLSTDTTDVNTRELSVVTNVDSISKYLQSLLKKFIGRSNVTPSLIALIETELQAGIAFLKSSGFAESIGGQLIDATVADIRQGVLKDHLIVVLNLEIPYPTNIIEVHLVI